MAEITFPSAEALPEDLRGFAKPVDGASDGSVVINLVPNDRLKEFRDKNVVLVKENEKLSDTAKQLAEIFPEFDADKVKTELSELRTTSQRVKDGTLKETKDVEEQVAARTGEMRRELETQIQQKGREAQDANNGRIAAENKVRSLILKQEISRVCMDEKSGVQPSAVPDIMSRAARVFEVKDEDTLIPKRGGEILYGADGATPMTAHEWVASLKQTNGHLFKQSGGGGTQPGNGPTKFGGFSKEEFDKLSPEKKIAVANAQKAAAAKRG